MAEFTEQGRRDFIKLLSVAAATALAVRTDALGAADMRGSGGAFTFNIGPYPSLGVFDYFIDAGVLRKNGSAAVKLEVRVLVGGHAVSDQSMALPADGRVSGQIKLRKFTDGTTYDLRAVIRDGNGHILGERNRSFTRRVMPFEKAARAGAGDDVLLPFTPPMIEGNSVSCLLRTYGHGTHGLLETMIAAKSNILVRPVVFVAVLGDGRSVVLLGDQARLQAQGKGSVDYRQKFQGGGVAIELVGSLDYDGFYQFAATFGPENGAVRIKELRLEIPFLPAHATLISAAADFENGWPAKSIGFLDAALGRLWDSHSLSVQWDKNSSGPVRRVSNMPPFVWVGDDERGLCYSCASDEGTHNDPRLPAAVVERTHDAVTLHVWLVNQPLRLAKPRHFDFALQASPFKPVAPNGRLWRNQPDAGATYKNGVNFRGWNDPAVYPAYGRWLTLSYEKQNVLIDGCNRSGIWGSAFSECAGTPEYKQFYYEWGSPMDLYDRKPAAVPADLLPRFKATGIRPNPFVMLEVFSNTIKSNRDYRAWWFSEAAKHADISYIYQDNPTFVFARRPQPDYGYKRADGGIEPTSMVWKSREMQKRFFQAVSEAGQPSQPAVWANMINPVVPGRAFCGKALDGEYTYSDAIPMGMLRVHLSKQWGFVVDWLCQQTVNPQDTTRAYWRALFSQLCLLDVTNFSRPDTAENWRLWLNALDVFWLDDPSIHWHPYYRNPTLASAGPGDDILVSTYTAKGRILATVSNRGERDTIAAVRLKDLAHWGAGGVKYFYDAETGEEIEFADDELRLFVGTKNYRPVLGFPQPWAFAAKNRLPNAQQIPVQSTLDAQATLNAICRHLLTARHLPALPGTDRLVEGWAQEILKELSMASADVVYLDAKATADINLGDSHVKCSVFFDRQRKFFLVGFYNGTGEHRALSSQVYERIAAKLGVPGHYFIYDAIGGQSEWSETHVPPHSGHWEVAYTDGDDYLGARRGVFKIGTMMSNILAAVEENKKTLQ